METLSELLTTFEPSKSICDLTAKFENIAKAAIYGGYFEINEGQYRIYILDVEFYFHSETDGIKEPKMYHQGKEIPYFPKGSLYPHQSGVDVTFEDEDKEYRASFLIRGYRYEDGSESYTNNEKSKDFSPRFLWEDLFGNAECIGVGKQLTIKWVDIDYEDNASLIQSVRVNLTGETAERPWRFKKNLLKNDI